MESFVRHKDTRKSLKLGVDHYDQRIKSFGISYRSDAVTGYPKGSNKIITRGQIKAVLDLRHQDLSHSYFYENGWGERIMLGRNINNIFEAFLQFALYNKSRERWDRVTLHFLNEYHFEVFSEEEIPIIIGFMGHDPGQFYTLNPGVHINFKDA